MNALQGKSAFEPQYDNQDSGQPEPVETEAKAPRRGRLRWLVVLAVLLAGGVFIYQTRLAPAPEAPVGALETAEQTTMRLNGAEIMTVEPVSLRDTIRVSGSLVPA